MDERFHECAMSSGAACPSIGPTKIFAKTTLGYIAKPFSTPRYDEYPVGEHPAPPQMGQYQLPGNLVDRYILLTSKEEILLQTHNRQYIAPPESTPTDSEAAPATIRQPLMTPFHNTEPPIHIPHIPLR
jgi:hypothetical protein